jgi:hypothetical protein
MYEACQNYTKVQLMTEMTELPLEDRTSLIDNNAHAMLTLKTAAYVSLEIDEKVLIKPKPLFDQGSMTPFCAK